MNLISHKKYLIMRALLIEKEHCIEQNVSNIINIKISRVYDIRNLIHAPLVQCVQWHILRRSRK